jgi:hypothetical protein
MKDKNGKVILPGMVLKINRYDFEEYCIAIATEDDGIELRDWHNNIPCYGPEEYEVHGWFWDSPEIVDDNSLQYYYGLNRDTANFIKEAIGK